MYQNDDFKMRCDRMSSPLLDQLFGNDNERSSRTGRCSSCEDKGQVQSGKNTFGLHGYPVAIVYSPIQEWRDLYECEVGFDNGTIFKELDLPFLGGSCGCGGGRNDR